MVLQSCPNWVIFAFNFTNLSLSTYPAIRYLLQFGEVSYYLGYNAMKNFFPSYRMNPNLECSSSWCQKRREEYEKRRASEPVVAVDDVLASEAVVVHEDNLYGKSIFEQ